MPYSRILLTITLFKPQIIRRPFSTMAKENPITARFRDYLRINTMQPNPDYAKCAEFLKQQAAEVGLEFSTFECVAGKPIHILSWPGEERTRKSVLLNSHTDVVPVFPECWKYEPFSAHKDEKGDIYARGSQDMKCVGMQYLEAIRKLKEAGVKLKRTFHLSYVPDEEIGGHDGMEKYVLTDHFKQLNIAFALDEGYANPKDMFTVFYGERSPWWVIVKCTGQPGHGSQFIPNTAGQKLRKVIDKFMDFRDNEETKLVNNPELCLGDVTTVNLTLLNGGVQHNVVPAELSVGFDMRIAPTVNLADLEKQIASWCKGAGDDVTYSFAQKNMDQKLTSVTTDNPWWAAFSSVMDEMKLKIKKEIFPAATDSRYLRKYDYPAIGFSPMNNTPILLHDHNEFLNEDIYLRGVDIYVELLKKLGNVDGE